jgi:hypothetical protein
MIEEGDQVLDSKAKPFSLVFRVPESHRFYSSINVAVQTAQFASSLCSSCATWWLYGSACKTT